MTAARLDLPDWPRLMHEPQAAAYLSISVSTLRAAGPKAKSHGRRILYDRHDLDRWADALGGQPLADLDRKREAAEVERRFMEKRRAAH